MQNNQYVLMLVQNKQPNFPSDALKTIHTFAKKIDVMGSVLLGSRIKFGRYKMVDVISTLL
jgi:hypothetical protein